MFNAHTVLSNVVLPYQKARHSFFFYYLIIPNIFVVTHFQLDLTTWLDVTLLQLLCIQHMHLVSSSDPHKQIVPPCTMQIHSCTANVPNRDCMASVLPFLFSSLSVSFLMLCKFRLLIHECFLISAIVKLKCHCLFTIFYVFTLSTHTM